MYKFNLNKLFQTICITFCISCVCAKLPDYIKKCSAGDKQCIINNIDTVFTDKHAGDSTFGLVKLDPIAIDDIEISQDASSPVSINLKFFRSAIHGGRNIRAVKVNKDFGKSPDSRHDLLLKASSVSLLGDYSVDGKVLVLPVKGEGKCNVTLAKPQLKITINGASQMKNDQLYMDVKSINLDLEAERVYMNFDNLFGGDKALGDTINNFINENWRELYGELRIPLVKKVTGTIYKTIKKVFDSTPYNDIFET